jgi:membrane protease YdiL (CAAX protease family)
MRIIARRTALIATALPVAVLSRVPGVAKSGDAGKRRPATAVPKVALLVTAPCWLLIVFRGVLYPAFGADDLEQSWGGPTLVGAWVTHLAVGVGALVVVSLALVLVTGARRSTSDKDSGPEHRDGPERAV